MSYCVVFGCKNRNVKKNYEQLEYEAKNQKISFHLFPKNVEKREQWLVAIRLVGIQVPKTAAVCSAHFHEEDYDPGHSLRKLKKCAVPHLPREEVISVKDEEKCIIPAGESATLRSVEERLVPSDTGTSTSIKIEESLTEKTKVNKSTCISPERLLNSPTKVQIREIHAREVALLRRKLSLSNYKNKQLQNKLDTLKNMLKELGKKNLVTSEDSHT